MDLDQRRRAQPSFVKNTLTVVSTDAGGEGLNLAWFNVNTSEVTRSEWLGSRSPRRASPRRASPGSGGVALPGSTPATLEL
jgi:hypothetical protein